MAIRHAAIVTQIKDERESFRTEFLVLSKNYRFNSYKTIRRIDDYMHSRFSESPPLDEDEFLKPFLNKTRPTVQIATKEMDLDTKDILIRAVNGDYFMADLESYDLDEYMREEGFATFLNDCADELPKGHIVARKDRKTGKMTLENLLTISVVDQSAESIFEAQPIFQRDVSLQSVLENKAWDKEQVKLAVEYYQQRNFAKMPVFERWGWVSEQVLNGGASDKYKYTLAVVAGGNLADDIPRKENEDEQPSFVFFFKEVDPDKFPYKEKKFMTVRSRWLGLGFPEILFDPQVRINEMAYRKAKGLQWSGLHLFATDDDSVASNALYDARDGQIVKMLPSKVISPIAMEERNLAAYNAEEQRWDENIQALTSTPDIAGGEGLPSGTTARSAILQDENFKRFFDRKREDFGIFVKEIIEELILPMFKTKKRKAHTLSFSGMGDDRDRLEDMAVTSRAIGKFQEYINRGEVPSMIQWQQDLGAIIRQVGLQKTLSIDIPEGAYDNIEERIKVVVTKENEDSDAVFKGIQLMIQTLATNPTVIVNPMTRPYFMEYAHRLGIKNVRVPSLLASMQQIDQMQQQGGEMLQAGAPPPGAQNSSILSRVPV